MLFVERAKRHAKRRTADIIVVDDKYRKWIYYGVPEPVNERVYCGDDSLNAIRKIRCNEDIWNDICSDEDEDDCDSGYCVGLGEDEDYRFMIYVTHDGKDLPIGRCALLHDAKLIAKDWCENLSKECVVKIKNLKTSEIYELLGEV